MKTQSNKIYFAGPLFSESEKNHNIRLAKLLTDSGYDVFLPQRDGFEGANEVNENEVVSQKIFQKDTAEIRKADIFFMVLDGRVPDDGACVELGYAYGLGKRCYGIKTDTRSFSEKFDLNPLIEGCFLQIFRDEKSLSEEGRLFVSVKAEDVLSRYLAKQEL